MSFFKRNDPSAPASRRAAQGGGGGTSAPYERLPAEHSSQPSIPSPQYQSGPPPRRNPVPAYSDTYDNHISPVRQVPSAQNAPSQPRMSEGYDDYRQEKTEYRPVQSQPSQPSRGYPGPRDDAHGLSAGTGRGLYNIAPCPSDPLALTNRLVVHSGDFPPDVEFVLLRNRFVLSIIRDPTRTLPPKHLGPSKFIRQWIGLSAVGETVECEPFHPSNGDWAASVELEVGFRLKRKETPDLFDSEDMAAAFISAFPSLPLTPLQPL
ncbi:MAG: transport between ER and Golgi ATPase protein, partial [Tremellales sp. Tagirdzhanova-0007]